jgi:GNAT superfamily N-acetyltransferase
MTTLHQPGLPGLDRRVRPATRADAAATGATLSRAFFDDPVMRWAVPDDQRRRRVLPDVFALYAAAILPHEASYLADGLAAALWVPPGELPVADSQAEEFSRRLEDALGVDADRMFEIVALLDEQHPHGAFYHLQLLGVVPERQGRGVGSAMLAVVLDRCDRAGLATYLEATSPANRRLYERHGFHAVGEVAPLGGPPLWPMWRPAFGAQPPPVGKAPVRGLTDAPTG